VIRECVTLHRGTAQDKSVTRIGDDNLFMAYAHVAHDCVIGNQCILANNATLGGHVRLDDWVIMGGLSAIHQFGRVGAHAFIANNAAVTRDVPPFVMAVGQPADAHSINAEGLKRRGFTPEQIRNIRAAFRVLYRSGLKLAEATAQLEALARDQPEILPLVEFLPQASRGIVR
jgi:UDP-N-acetylglucosamine acyltransferase